MFTSIETPEGPIGVHLNLAKAPTVVPAGERHKWHPAGKLARGSSAACLCCRLEKLHQYNYLTTYKPAGASTFRVMPMPRCKPPTPTV